MDSFEVTLMFRVATLTIRSIPCRKSALTISVLKDICRLCDQDGLHGLVIKVALLVGYLPKFSR